MNSGFLRMDSHANSRPLKATPKQVSMINLEADSFKLLEQRIQYDLQCLRVARSRLETHEGAVYHQTLTHRKHAYEVSASAATAFFDANVKVICSTTAADVVAAFHKFEDHFCRNYGLEKQNMEL